MFVTRADVDAWGTKPGLFRTWGGALLWLLAGAAFWTLAALGAWRLCS